MKTLTSLLLVLMLSGCTTLMSSATGDKPITPDPESRSMGQVIDDNALATRLTVNLTKIDKRFEQAQFDVHVHDGVVLLVGQVPDAEMIRRATEMARNDPQVEAVHNHLAAAPPTTAGIRANDTWLAVKVRSRMFTTDHFPSSNINIIVEEGIVYLMGRVTEPTARQAVKLASEVNGVQKVVTVFTLVQ